MAASWWLRMFVHASRHCLEEASSWARSVDGGAVCDRRLQAVSRKEQVVRHFVECRASGGIVGDGGHGDPAGSCVCNGSRAGCSCHRRWNYSTYLFQHLLRLGEVGEHSFDIGLVGRPFQETPKGALGSLHLARQPRWAKWVQTTAY